LVDKTYGKPSFGPVFISLIAPKPVPNVTAGSFYQHLLSRPIPHLQLRSLNLIIGSQASILIHEVLVAMKAAAANSNQNSTNYIESIDDITRNIHIHPSLSEVIVKTVYDI
jgi:hypothetical protein